MTQKVLIIDDSPLIQRIIRESLKDERLELQFASNGTDGLNLARSTSPDLILLDVEMPPPDGFETCRQLKMHDSTASIPVVFLTSLCSTEEKVAGLDLGAIDYVTKPFQAAELCARVRATLRVKYMSDLLSQKAMIDGLTGLWNRAYLDQRLAAEMSLCARDGSVLSVIMADIDKFKSINDTHGHPFGDEVLRSTARAFSSCCRKEDILCRYGGEEFAILTPRVSLGGALALAGRMREVISQLVIKHRAANVTVSCSFGVAEFTSGLEGNVVESADRALYQAKHSGRNRVVSAADLQPQLVS